MKSYSKIRYHIFLAVLIASCLATPAFAQFDAAPASNVEVAQVAEEAKPTPQSPSRETPVPGQATAPGRPGAPTSGQPGAKPADAAKPGEEAKPTELQPVKRTAEPPEPPDPAELKVLPNEEGMVRFQFRNQPWPEVVRWLASVSDLSLDWQELPGDYINLATQRPFTLEEASDMINRALLARGFTLLKHDGVLLVAKIDSLNPAMVPRVRPEELANLPPHSFVRTSFPLTWLIAEEIHEEFSSMISKNGKLTPLVSTNRLEGMDAASNLRDIYEILEMEQSTKALENLAREFILTHARASSVKVQLQEFLGITSPTGGGGGSRDAAQMMQQQMQQQMQQMQQQMQQAQRGGSPGGKPPSTARKRLEDVYLVANDRSNSVIVHASPDKMAIIASFIARVDVPNENAADFQRLNTRMKVFRLASLSPTELVGSLTAMDVLEPTTRLQVDQTNNAIIAYASVADQYLIQSVVDRLDGSERSFEVLQLRRLDAEAVAGSIKFLMGAEEETNSSSNRSSYSYYDYYGGYGNRNSKPEKTDKMRVGANVQDNQVLLWANAIEMEEVQKLLVKLGEVPPEGGRQSTVRVIDASRQPETFEYLKRLKEQWDRVSPNPLQIPDAAEFVLPEDAKPAVDKPEPKDKSKLDEGAPPSPEKPPATTEDKITHAPPAAHVADNERLVSSPFDQSAAANPSAPSTVAEGTAASDGATANGESAGGATEPLPAAPPVAIMIDEAGNLIIQSNDTAALDRLEEIMLANRPPRRPYDVFKVKYASAGWVTLNLRDYFEKKEEEEEYNPYYSFFYGGRSQGNQEKETEQLGKKPPLRFIYDNDTDSIVVQGADDTDRKTIRELIELWDVPEPEDEEDTDRYTRLLRIKYSRADAIVGTIKEAYRDLLSATDKSVQTQQGGENEEEKRSGSGGGGVVQPSGALSFAFKGKLSLGADTITNSILVSAEGEALMEVICDMIDQLDRAAQPEGNFEVYKLTPEVNGKSLERALRAMLQSPKQQQATPGQNGQNPQNGQNAQNGPNGAVQQNGGTSASTQSNNAGRGGASSNQ